MKSITKLSYGELLFRTTGILVGLFVAVLLFSCKKKAIEPEPQVINETPVVNYGGLALETYIKCGTAATKTMIPGAIFFYKSLSDKDNGIAFRKEYMHSYYDTIPKFEARTDGYYAVINYTGCNGTNTRSIVFRILKDSITYQKYTMN